MDKFKNLAKNYDQFHPKEAIFEQKSFFEKNIKNHSINSCLDCACGTGWHLLMLDQLGIKCFGSDLSEEMLKFARTNLRETNIPLKKQDYRYLEKSWDKEVDMVICMTTALPHMLTTPDIIEALNSMYAMLNDGGILVISNGISDSLIDSKPKFIPGRVLENHAMFFVMEYPKDRVIFNILNVEKSPKSFDYSFEQLEYNALRKSHLEDCFSQTNFNHIDYYGDYNLTKYSTKDSKRLIVIAQK